MSTNVTTLDPTASCQQQWFDTLRSSSHTPTSAIISTTSTFKNLRRADELTEEFYRALSLLHELPNLTNVALHFGSHCRGAESAEADSAQTLMSGTFENKERRLNVLHAFFEATAAHARAQPESRIRTITIKNLQNDPDNEAITTSAAFLDTMNYVKALHLHVCTEWSEENPWAAAEMQRFWPHLRTGWLEPVKPQLESLTLYCDNFWGVWPRFDTTGLVFPNLKRLALGSFVFGLNEQLQWLTAQKALRHLNLDACAICSRWEIEHDVYKGLDESGSFFRRLEVVTPLDPDDPDGFEWWVLGYDGTWSRYFECIAQNMPNLHDFDFRAQWLPVNDAPGGFMPARRADVVFDRREEFGTPPVDAETHPRYLCYSTMNGYESIMLPDPEDTSMTGRELDLKDQRALDGLLRVTRARRKFHELP